MMFVAACLIGIVFLSVRVQPEDPNDETNAIICLNTTGHNCNTNTSSGPPAHLMKTTTKPTNRHSPEWEMFKVFHCTNDDCIHKCEDEGHTHSTCLLNGESCHCYSQTINITKGPGSVDTDDLNCENEDCATRCKINGFAHSICTDDDGCHCYESSTPEPQTLNPTQRLTTQPPSIKLPEMQAPATQSPTSQPPTTQLPETQPPEILAPTTLSPAQPLATQLPETQRRGMQAPATESPKAQPPTTTTALQTHRVEPPPRPWDDFRVENNTGERTLEIPSKEKEYLELKFQLCLKPSCIYSCRTKDYSDGTCTSVADCRCSRLTDTKDILVILCNRYTCSYFCSMEDYSYGTCTNMENCQCTKRKSSVKSESAHEKDFPFKLCYKKPCTYYCTSLKKYSDGSCTNDSNCHCKGMRESRLRSRKTKSTLFDQKNCSEALCEVFCREGGHSKNICIDEQRCKCGDLVPTPPKMNEGTTEPLPTPKLATLDKLKDNEIDISVRVCILAQCKYMCIKRKYKKGFCVHGNPPKCHCHSL